MTIRNEFLVYDGLRDCIACIKQAESDYGRGDADNTKALLKHARRILFAVIEVSFSDEPGRDDVARLSDCSMEMDIDAGDRYMHGARGTDEGASRS